MSRSGRFFPFSAVAALVLFPGALAAQHDGMHHHHAASGGAADEPVVVSGLRIPDVELLDQRGNRVHFYSDLVKGKVVAINTIFTTCTTICPLMGANFSKLGRLLGSETRGKFSLISISIDPLNDTPERLLEWSSAFGQTGADWTIVTGSKSDVEALLKALQVFTADKQDHAPVVLVGGEGTGEWSRASALLPPARLAELIQGRLALTAASALSRP